MTKKEKCKEIMARLFGPATPQMVNRQEEDTVVEWCRTKVTAMLGPEAAKEFDTI